jgi:hypothetical protein
VKEASNVAVGAGSTKWPEETGANLIANGDNVDWESRGLERVAYTQGVIVDFPSQVVNV